MIRQNSDLLFIQPMAAYYLGLILPMYLFRWASWLVDSFVYTCKVIYPKYSKHLPYTAALTIECVCSKMLNHGLNSLFKFFGWKYILNWKTRLLYCFRSQVFTWNTSHSARNQPILFSQIAVLNGFFQMFMVVGMYNFGCIVYYNLDFERNISWTGFSPVLYTVGL